MPEIVTNKSNLAISVYISENSETVSMHPHKEEVRFNKNIWKWWVEKGNVAVEREFILWSNCVFIMNLEFSLHFPLPRYLFAIANTSHSVGLLLLFAKPQTRQQPSKRYFTWNSISIIINKSLPKQHINWISSTLLECRDKLEEEVLIPSDQIITTTSSSSVSLPLTLCLAAVPWRLYLRIPEIPQPTECVYKILSEFEAFPYFERGPTIHPHWLPISYRATHFAAVAAGQSSRRLYWLDIVRLPRFGVFKVDITRWSQSQFAPRKFVIIKNKLGDEVPPLPPHPLWRQTNADNDPFQRIRMHSLFHVEQTVALTWGWRGWWLRRISPIES